MTPSFTQHAPDGDTVPRAVCDRCGFISYDNPKIVVGSVVSFGGKILLCRRAIEPSRGLWTIPAGYMEHGETPEEGARREAYEEATAAIRIEALLAIYSIERIGQVQLIYRACLDAAHFAPGPESEAVRLFDPADVPWPDLAFPSVHWALNHAQESGGPFTNPVDPGSEMWRPR